MTIRNVTIDRLGAQGDGVATVEGLPVYVPNVLPGERVRIEISGNRARLLEILEPSPQRVSAPCPHFGVCGGCALQHMEIESYRRWKIDILRQTLAHRGFHDLPIRDMITSPSASRRRVSFRAVKQRGRTVVGFNQRLSHEIVAVENCIVSEPALVRVMTLLSATLAPLPLAKNAGGIATLTDTGVDLSLHGIRRLDLAAREALGAFARNAGIARLTVDDETVIEQASPQILLGGVAVTVPPGAFLQATPEGEKALQAAVSQHMRDAARVADLFSGLGTFTFPLAGGGAEVQAFDSDSAGIAALSAATRRAGLHRVTGAVRDLFRNPLSPDELQDFDAAVIDPPRAGAQAQTAALAASGIRRLALVSCNPGTFARDIRILLDRNYEILAIHPVDQFLWSPHLELVALLVRR